VGLVEEGTDQCHAAELVRGGVDADGGLHGLGPVSAGEQSGDQAAWHRASHLIELLPVEAVGVAVGRAGAGREQAGQAMAGVEQLGGITEAVGGWVGPGIAAAQWCLGVEHATGRHHVDRQREAGVDNAEAARKAVGPARITSPARDQRAGAGSDVLAGQGEVHSRGGVDALLGVAKQLIRIDWSHAAAGDHGRRGGGEDQAAGTTHATPPSVTCGPV
jgi:hypothetical protein